MCDSFILFISLSGVKKLGSLTQGRYTWRNNQVLKCLAAALESCPTGVTSLPPPSSCWKPTPFVREGKGQASLTTVRPDWSAGLSTGLEDAGRPGHETLLPSWDRIHQPATRPCFVVSFTQACLHHRAHCTLGGCSGGGLRAEGAEVRRTRSRCSTTRLESEGLPSQWK